MFAHQLPFGPAVPLSSLPSSLLGVVLIEARIVELVLPVGAAQEVRLNAHSSLEHILSWLPSMTYAGCAGCGAELHTDENKIYRQCLRCLPLSGKKTYYR